MTLLLVMLAGAAYLLIGGALNWFITEVIDRGEDSGDDGFVVLLFWPLILAMFIVVLITFGIQKITNYKRRRRS